MTALLTAGAHVTIRPGTFHNDLRGSKPRGGVIVKVYPGDRYAQVEIDEPGPYGTYLINVEVKDLDFPDEQESAA